MPLITGAHLARVCRVSRPAVSQAVRARNLPREASGLFNTENPIVRTWAVGQAFRLGIESADILTELDRSPAPKPKVPAPEDMAPWTRQTADPGREVSSLEIRADFGDGPVLVVRHGFDAQDRELDLTVGPVPRKIRLAYDGPDPQVLDAETGEPIPTSCTIRERGRELVREVHG